MATAARRTYASYHASRGICFIPALAAPVWGWDYLGRPLDVPGMYASWWHAAGLGAMMIAGLLVIPAVFVTVVCFGPDLPKMCVPRKWRAMYRNREDRYGNKKRTRKQQKSEYISDRLRYLVNRIDRYRCIGCGVYDATDVDHRIPWSWGGLTILWNCFTLCAACNRNIKVDYWEDWRGVAHFGRYFNRANRDAAHAIFRRESRRRLNPLRTLRLAWAVGT